MGYESSTLIGKLFGVTAIGFVAFEFGGSVVHFFDESIRAAAREP
jgi:hypothetical protein